jgi:hypothetical protein
VRECHPSGTARSLAWQNTVVSEICEAVFDLDSERRNRIEAVRVIGSDGEEGGCA